MGELIVDPFAGTGTWGEIAAGCGGKWVGADVVRGGAAVIEVRRQNASRASIERRAAA
jgi:tRNA G10  N-methylase Trm11